MPSHPPSYPWDMKTFPQNIQSVDPLDFTPFLRDKEEQDMEYLSSLSMIQEAKDANICSRAGCEAVAHKASVKESECWALFPAPAMWVSQGPEVSLLVAMDQSDGCFTGSLAVWWPVPPEQGSMAG